MSNIVNIGKFKHKREAKQKDPWCAKLVYPDGSSCSGSAARESRLKAVGGVDALLRATLQNASAMARKSN
jgi:hypothetical protein